MKKQEYIDIGLSFDLSPSQIEGVLCKVLDVSREEFVKLSEISSKFIYEVQQVFFKLRSGESEEYMLGKANFYGRDFFVDERVLIPRNDTEVLVSSALEKINTQIDIKNMLYIDVGTGSACIPVSIVSEMNPLKFEKNIALDISKKALEVAAKNIETHCPGKIELRESDLLSAIFHDEILQGKKLSITANLPYIKNGDYENMDQQVADNEPDSALYGGKETGFEMYEKLIRQCFQIKQVHKIQEIHLFIEIGFDQKARSSEYLRELGLSFEYFNDSATIERVIYINGF